MDKRLAQRLDEFPGNDLRSILGDVSFENYGNKASYSLS